MSRTILTILCVLFATAASHAEQKSVNPGINKSFETTIVSEFVERFEKEGRDAFDH